MQTFLNKHITDDNGHDVHIIEMSDGVYNISVDAGNENHVCDFSARNINVWTAALKAVKGYLDGTS